MTIVRNSCQEEIREIKSWILSGDTTEQQIITINKSIQNLFESMEQGSSGPVRELHDFLDKHLKTDSVFGLSKLKPRGYAGDFESIDRVHTYFISENPKYTHLDRFLQATQAAIAVRNRKIYLKNKLFQLLHLQNRSNVLNIGCGPARDVYEFFVEHPEANITIEDAYVIVNRMEGADEALKELGVKLHAITNVMQITQALHEQKLVDSDTLEKVRNQINK